MAEPEPAGTLLVRTRGGSIAHRPACRVLARTTRPPVPWAWAEGKARGDVAATMTELGVRACVVCDPLRALPEELTECWWCQAKFDLEVQGGRDEHYRHPLCDGCWQPCHCPDCDPDHHTDLADDLAAGRV